MGREIFEPLVTIAAGVIGVAIIAVLVSNKAQTGNVLASAGGAFSNVLSAATAPVTGNAAAPNVNAGAGSGGSVLGSGLNLFGGGNIANFPGT
jgi:PRD1 phage membrane DNA delivery